jgi:fatty acid desaturase
VTAVTASSASAAVPALPADDEIAALAALRERVRREGFTVPTPSAALVIFGVHLAIMTGGIAAFVYFDSWCARAVAILFSTYGALGVGMTGHNASHIAITGSRKLDRGLTLLAMTVLNGLSETYWRHKHIRLHHAGPNAIGLDTDIDLMPYFALNRDELATARGWRRRFYRIQHWVFPFAVGLNLINLKWTGIRYLVDAARERGGRLQGIGFDALCLTGHVLLFIVVPAFIWPLWQVIGFYLLRETLNGYATFIGAAPAHFPAEAIFVHPGRGQTGAIAGQILTTVNFRTGLCGRLACLGAEYQIEHHLLPEVNPLKMREVSRLVETYCQAWGYPYRSLGWWEGIIKSLRAVRDPKPIHLLNGESGNP